ncbi:helix-turn-helix domain-containing protein [Flavobacterium sp. T12S277]|uniref:helix-turn-helix domain-containing protein n=1 Tax=Flavobacterium sp. T12S277 TaxID=3402752 RepID=UPI003ADF4D42
MGNPTDRLWLSELKVLYLADYKKIQTCNTIINPGWFSLVIVVSGSINFTENSSNISVSAGDMFAVPNWAELNRLSSPLRVCLISCTMDFAIFNKAARFESSCIKLLANQSSFVLSLTSVEMRHMIRLFGLLEKKISSEDAIFQYEMVMHCLNLIFYEFCELYYKYNQVTAALHHRNDKTVTNFITLAQLHCKEHHEVKFYADSLFVSRGHLNKIVRNVIGMSPKHFTERALISEAYQLLADNNLSIAEVAEYLNFKDSSSFSHFFKRHTRLSPSQYRLNLKFKLIVIGISILIH